MGLGKNIWRSLRTQIQSLFSRGSRIEPETLPEILSGTSPYIFHVSKVQMLLPAKIGDYTDFYSSYNHAYNVGKLFRGPENAI